MSLGSKRKAAFIVSWDADLLFSRPECQEKSEVWYGKLKCEREFKGLDATCQRIAHAYGSKT